ncbi:MAG: FUN14 domain-containing protein [Nitrospira sp.]|nr:FUN14 domain-containing protein [Nitrospira sp.]
MEQDQDQPHESSHQGVLAALLAEAPWNATSVVVATAATIGGLVSWVADFSSPTLAGIGGSYLAGFFLGWASRRFLKIAALVTGGLLAAFAVLEETGWINLDWTTLESHITYSITALRLGTLELKHLLSGYLPSTGAVAVGMFFGFLKK